MINTITGCTYLQMVESGINNVQKNKQMLNDLNVFPVPDGDTGTNMAMTLKYGLGGFVENDSLELAAKSFASFAVFGARGNSGVILSQFLKGVAEGFDGYQSADTTVFFNALKKGCEFAYASVAKPVEGTMLTVIREAIEAVEPKMPLESFQDLLALFTTMAESSLRETPNKLPVLKKAGVVDSGGAGIVCFFDGMAKYLSGQVVDSFEDHDNQTVVDFSSINKDTPLDYGYCTEGLIQLKIDVSDFQIEEFRQELSQLGTSVVCTLEVDKVKMHVHTKKLDKVFRFCQKFGEFLTIKIENMSVQKLQNKAEETRKFLVSEQMGEDFNIVAVASNPYLQKEFVNMGADVVIMSEITPASQDYIDAFSHTNAKKVLVFPNGSNAILTAIQAGGLVRDKKITVINSRSMAECMLALPVIDFDGTVDDAFEAVNQVINNCSKAFVYHAVKEITFGKDQVRKNDFFSMANSKQIITIQETLDKAVLETVKIVLSQREASLITIFYGDGMAEEYIDYLSKKITSLGLDVEINAVCTMEGFYSIVLTFE